VNVLERIDLPEGMSVESILANPKGIVHYPSAERFYAARVIYLAALEKIDAAEMVPADGYLDVKSLGDDMNAVDSRVLYKTLMVKLDRADSRHDDFIIAASGDVLAEGVLESLGREKAALQERTDFRLIRVLEPLVEKGARYETVEDIMRDRRPIDGSFISMLDSRCRGAYFNAYIYDLVVKLVGREWMDLSQREKRVAMIGKCNAVNSSRRAMFGTNLRQGFGD
jgi:hypothetical protein